MPIMHRYAHQANSVSIYQPFVISIDRSFSGKNARIPILPLEGVLTTEAIRTAMRQFGNQPLTGAQVQWGLEHLTLTAASLKALGAEGLFPPLTLSCRDHEGGGSVKFQQWDGTQWTVLTDWIAPDQALVRPLVEASAAKYAQEKGITPRDCP